MKDSARGQLKKSGTGDVSFNYELHSLLLVKVSIHALQIRLKQPQIISGLGILRYED